MQITFDKSAAAFVLSALNATNCSFCGVDLTPDNFAGATRLKYSCKNFTCLIELAGLMREKPKV